MFDLGTVGSAVVLDGSQYFGTLNQLHGRTNATMMQVKQIMTRALGVYGAYKLFKDAAKAGMEFGDEMANIQSIADNLDMGKVRRNLLGLNANLGKSTNLANSFYYAYSAGMRGTERDLVRFTASMSRGAKAVGSEQVPYMDAATTTINSYGLAIKDAGMINDWFYQIVKQGKAVGPELAQGLGMIVGTASQAGISLDELGSGLATLTQIMPTSQAIVGLNQSILAFVSPTKEAKEVAAELGIELTASALKSKGLVESFKEIEEKAGDNVEALSAMFGNVRAFRVAAQLAGEQGEKFGDILEKFKDKAGTSLEAFEVKVKTTGQSWRNAMVDWNKSLIDLSDAIDPVSRKIAEMISWVAQNRGAMVIAGAVTGVMVWQTGKWLIQLVRVPGALLKATGAISANTIAMNANNKAISANALLRTRLQQTNTTFDAFTQNAKKMNTALYASNGTLVGLKNSVNSLGKLTPQAAARASLLSKSWLVAAGAAKTLGSAAKMAAGNIGLVAATGYGGYKAGNWLYDKFLKESDQAEELEKVSDYQNKLNSFQTASEQRSHQRRKNYFYQRLDWLRKEGKVSAEEYENIRRRFFSKNTKISGQAYTEVFKRYDQVNNHNVDDPGLAVNNKIMEQMKKRREEAAKRLAAFKAKYSGLEGLQKNQASALNAWKSMLFMDDNKFDTQDKIKTAKKEIELRKQTLDEIEKLKEEAIRTGSTKERDKLIDKYNEEVQLYRQAIERKKQLDKDYVKEKQKKDPLYQLQQLRKGYRVRQAILDRDGGRAGSDRSQIRDYLKVSTPEERKEYQKILANAMRDKKLGSTNDREQIAFQRFTTLMERKQAKDDAKLTDVTKKMETIIEKLEKLSNGEPLVLN